MDRRDRKLNRRLKAKAHQVKIILSPLRPPSAFHVPRMSDAVDSTDPLLVEIRSLATGVIGGSRNSVRHKDAARRLGAKAMEVALPCSQIPAEHLLETDVREVSAVCVCMCVCVCVFVWEGRGHTLVHTSVHSPCANVIGMKHYPRSHTHTHSLSLPISIRPWTYDIFSCRECVCSQSVWPC